MVTSKYWRGFVEAALIGTALPIGLVLIRVLLTGSSRFTFVPENLLLAWIPFLTSLYVSAQLTKNRSWRQPRLIILSLLWLVFLPNTWYVLTDFIHVRSSGQVSQLFDIVLVMSLVLTGFALGFASLYLMHKQLAARLKYWQAYLSIELVVLMCSFAIYLGRNLRWNTWDVITDPTGLLLDVSDRLVDPFGHPRAFSITVLFFVLISGLYAALWRIGRLNTTTGR